MFRFLTLLFLTIYVIDLATGALETGRVWFMWDIFVKRKTSPIAYWVMTVFWSLLAVGSAFGVLLLSYQALVGSGPYKDHAFYSMHQAWPYAAMSIVLGGLAVMIIKERLQHRRHKPAA